MNVLLIDNYDSFTHNLGQLIASLAGPAVALEVVRNDAEDAEDLAAQPWSHVVLSPGPGHPRDSGLSLSLPALLPNTPVLGVCLGHQALAWAQGACIVRATRPTHGATQPVHHDRRGVFEGLPDPFDAALYHSLAVGSADWPATLTIRARSPHGDIMAAQHAARPHLGVQFHPESFMTPHGPRLVQRFLGIRTPVSPA